jgi:hypothetical protein
MQDGIETGQHDPSVFQTRLLIGLIQGVLLFVLLRISSTQLWPATVPLLYSPLVGITLLAPPLLIVSCAYIPVRRLMLWLLPIAVLIALVAGYAEWRSADLSAMAGGASRYEAGPAIALMVPLLFVVWSLIQASDQDKRWPAAYTTYFETGWKLFIQHLFVTVFVGVFWLILWLGVGLFMMLNMDFLRTIVRSDWFWLPATTLIMACGFHLTDVRPGIVSGIRNLLLSMLSWLLPLLTGLVAAFLISVPLAGFDLLWKTRFATALLLGTCVVLVVLINTAFQDGSRAESTHKLLRHSARLAAVLLLPLALIAAYALSLRVGQYGWSPDRIFAALCVVIALFYAVGYLWAVLEPLKRRNGEWLPRVAIVNIYAAVLMVVLGLAVLTPVADPARVSVSSQLGMLESGRIPAAQFDFKFLRFEGVRYGTEALARLADSPDVVIGSKAREARALTHRWAQSSLQQPELAEQLLLRTPGKIWPQGFLDTTWSNTEPKWQLPACLREAKRHCDAYIGDFSGEKRGEVLLVPHDYGRAVLLSDRDGSWRPVRTFEIPGKCARLRDDLAVGKFQPTPAQGMDLMVGNIRLRAESVQPERSKCE